MRRGVGAALGVVVASGVVLVLVLLVASAPAAAPRSITGRLDKSGFTVIALAANGAANSVVAKHGSFSLRPPAGTVTLQLRAPNGLYAGPVVVSSEQRGSRTIMGLRAGARLGKIQINARRGYAKVAHKIDKRWIDRTRWARARGGVPIGAGNFGRVRSKPPRVSPPGDLDADGIPNPLDVDDDGDLILDDVDTRTAARAKIAQLEPSGLGAWTLLYELGGSSGFGSSQPVNVNAPGITPADVEAALVGNGELQVAGSVHTYASGELDCGGLSYCSAGGSGKKLPLSGPVPNGPDPAVAFPACCDLDGNGLGAFDIGTGAFGVPNGSLRLLLEPHATSDQIRAGDVLIARSTCASPCAPDGSTQLKLATTLASVFATVPAIKSYTTEDGVTHSVSYPLPPNPQGAEGTLAVADGPDPGTDVSVKLTFWRPQRRALPEEVAGGQGDWIDMGHLVYFAHTLTGPGNKSCPADAYSDPAGGTLSTVTGLGPLPTPALTDQANDQPSNPDNTFSYTLDLTRCLTANGENFDTGGIVVFDAFLPPNANQPQNFAESAYRFQNQTGPPPAP